MEKLLPEHLKDFWQSMERRGDSCEDYTREYDRALAEYRQTWTRALILRRDRSTATRRHAGGRFHFAVLGASTQTPIDRSSYFL